MSIKVDLPAPEGPTRAVSVPFTISAETLRSAGAAWLPSIGEAHVIERNRTRKAGERSSPTADLSLVLHRFETLDDGIERRHRAAHRLSGLGELLHNGKEPKDHDQKQSDLFDAGVEPGDADVDENEAHADDDRLDHHGHQRNQLLKMNQAIALPPGQPPHFIPLGPFHAGEAHQTRGFQAFDEESPGLVVGACNLAADVRRLRHLAAQHEERRAEQEHRHQRHAHRNEQQAQTVCGSDDDHPGQVEAVEQIVDSATELDCEGVDDLTGRSAVLVGERDVEKAFEREHPHASDHAFAGRDLVEQADIHDDLSQQEKREACAQ